MHDVGKDETTDLCLAFNSGEITENNVKYDAVIYITAVSTSHPHIVLILSNSQHQSVVNTII